MKNCVSSFRGVSYDLINAVYFNSVAWAFSMKDYVQLLEENNCSPKETYDAISAIEESNQDVRWYHRIWQTLPPTWNIFIYSFCRNDSIHPQPKYYKALRLTGKVLMMCINLMATFVAVVSCGATVEIRRTKEKLPAVRNILYGEK